MGPMGITEAAEKFAAMPSNRHLFRDQCLRVEVDAEGVVFHMIVRRDEAYWCENPRSGDPRKLVSQ